MTIVQGGTAPVYFLDFSSKLEYSKNHNTEKQKALKFIGNTFAKRKRYETII